MKNEEITVFFNDQKLQGFDMNLIEKIEKPEEPKNQVERIVNTFPSRLREQIYDLAKQGCKNCKKHQDRQCYSDDKDCETFWANVAAVIKQAKVKVNDQEIDILKVF